MKGYKAFNWDLTCRGFQYEIGKTYELEGKLEICKKGFHFCEKLEDVFDYYPFSATTRVAEVESLGNVVTKGNKSCTDKIKIIRELSPKECLDIMEINRDTYNICLCIHKVGREIAKLDDVWSYGLDARPFYWNLVSFASYARLSIGRNLLRDFILVFYADSYQYIINLEQSKQDIQEELLIILDKFNDFPVLHYFISRLIQELELI